MKRVLKDIQLLKKYSPEMGGVFSTGDLERLFNQNNKVLLFRRLKELEEALFLRRFVRGFYVSPDFNRDVLCMRINPDSYISLGTILAKNMVIGSVPQKTLYAVKLGKSREYKGYNLTIKYCGISESLFFGYNLEENIRVATVEKALLDTLYFYQKGYAFSFNIYEDIETSVIDKSTMLKMLEKYNNPRFYAFVKGYINDRN